jgi:cytoskeletal protein CcmA (bactofilin family)
MNFFRREKKNEEEELQAFYQNLQEMEQPPYEGDEQAEQPVQYQPGPVAPQIPGAEYGQPVLGSQLPAASRFEDYRRNATVVAQGTTFNGKLKSENNLYIEGTFDGELEAQDAVFIADTAQVNANVKATDVIVAGQLTGTVNASNRFHALASAQVSGQINSSVLVVEKQAAINCTFSMRNREERYA